MNSVKRSACRISAALAAIFLTVVFACMAQAQFNGGMGLGQFDLIRQVRQSAEALRQYRQSHDHFPRQQAELDEALLTVFKQVAIARPNTTVFPQSNNIFRTYAQFAIAYDPTIHLIPVINGQIQIDNAWTSTWSMPVNTIVMVTDGNNQFVVWAAGADGKPLQDPNTNTPMIIDETVAPASSQ
jgi:hypothetical protein